MRTKHIFLAHSKHIINNKNLSTAFQDNGNSFSLRWTKINPSCLLAKRRNPSLTRNHEYLNQIRRLI